MQFNGYPFCPGCLEGSGLHQCRNAVVNANASTDVPSMFINLDFLPEAREWSSAPITGNGDCEGSLIVPSAPSPTAEHSNCALPHRSAADRTHPDLLPCFEPSIGAYMSLWRSVVAISHAPAPIAPQRDGACLSPTPPPNRSQAPSEHKAYLACVRSQSSDKNHAVQAPAQQVRVACDPYHHIRHPVPGSSFDTPPFPEVGTSSGGSSQTCAGELGDVGARTANPAPWQDSSPSNRRRSHARAEDNTVCEGCKKWMRRRSLKRHIREVHDRIKRPHPKSRLAAARPRS